MRPIPHHCLICLSITRRPVVCSSCRARIIGDAIHRQTCDAPELFSLGPFAGGLRQLVLRLKHQRDGAVGDWLGAQLAAQLPPRPRPEAITWVPGQWHNRVRRGGDPAAHIARGLGQALSINQVGLLHSHLGWHSRHRSRVQRSHAKFWAVPSDIRRVWLVDDTHVTGKTLAAAVDALGCAGIQVEAMLTAAS